MTTPAPEPPPMATDGDDLPPLGIRGQDIHPSAIQVCAPGGTLVARILYDGGVEFGPGISPDAAAREFYDALAGLIEAGMKAKAGLVAEVDAELGMLGDSLFDESDLYHTHERMWQLIAEWRGRVAAARARLQPKQGG